MKNICSDHEKTYYTHTEDEDNKGKQQGANEIKKYYNTSKNPHHFIAIKDSVHFKKRGLFLDMKRKVDTLIGRAFNKGPYDPVESIIRATPFACNAASSLHERLQPEATTSVEFQFKRIAQETNLLCLSSQ